MAPSLRRLLVKIYTVLTVHVMVRSYNLSYHPKRKYSSIHIEVTEAKKGIRNTNNISYKYYKLSTMSLIDHLN